MFDFLEGIINRIKSMNKQVAPTSGAHPLDRDYWVTKDGRELYPAKGEMTPEHIHNTMHYIRNHRDVVNWFMELDILRGELKHTIPYYVYLHDRVEKSRLWEVFNEGLKYHKELQQKANKLNEGVLEDHDC